ncbi:hypothetical protein IFM89_008183 [Coptis chinensis]|uniref:GTD-binding domain-containing protein n=1 Tax=Coptis chinensis TaxID=261450 RepID=A0A835LU36_9MAGN|nr:hypothetical protein IFM89_008183 [Coptis chinensis]
MMDYGSSLNFSSKKTDFGGGVFMFGNFAAFGNMLLLFFILVLGFKVLYLDCYYNGLVQFLDNFRGKADDFRHGFCSSIDVCGMCYSKISSCKVGILNLLDNSVPDLKNPVRNKEISIVVEETSILNESVDNEEEKGGEEEFGDEYKEDEERDLQALRKAVRIQRERVRNACLELEKERLAAASAANETMAMIMRLQSELSSIQMQANQYQRMAEQKQLHDQEVIHSLRWIVLKQESERSILESQLNLCNQERMMDWKAGDEDGLEGIDCTPNRFSASSGGDLAEELISSLDMDSVSKVSSHFEEMVI